MRRRRSLQASIVIVCLTLVAGCQKKTIETTPPPETQRAVETPAPTKEPAREVTESFKPEVSPESEAVVEPTIDEMNRSGVLATVYFDYDKSELSPEARSTLQKNADWMKRNPSRAVEIGGHCDERGTIEYNIALGERRAVAVRSYLTSLGVEAARLTIVSYGEERPSDPGHDESAWRQNRRAEFLIKS